VHILSTTEHTAAYYGEVTAIIIAIILASILVVSVIIISREDGVIIKYAPAYVITLLFLVALVLLLWHEIEQGVNVTYKATITDFNEVYENGYKIVDRDGDIYILEKEVN